MTRRTFLTFLGTALALTGPLYELRRLELPVAVAFRVHDRRPVTVLVPPSYTPLQAHLAALRLVFGKGWQTLCADPHLQGTVQ